MSYFRQHAQKGNWDKETSSSSLGTFATNLFFASSHCSASNRLSFTLFARERGFTAIAVLLVEVAVIASPELQRIIVGCLAVYIRRDF
jgi:hypothetical protein